jgi:hypothetical protein
MIHDADRIDPDLPAMRPPLDRAHADRRMPVLVRVQGLRRMAQAAARRLLRVLLLQHGAVSAGPAGGVSTGPRRSFVEEGHDSRPWDIAGFQALDPKAGIEQ